MLDVPLVALLSAGDFAGALGPLRAEAHTGAASPAMMLNLAIAEDRAGDRNTARRLMRTLAVRLPDWDEPWLRLAESFRKAGEMTDAEDAYRQALDLNPNRSEVLTALAGLLLLRGIAAEAVILLRRCCAIHPRNAEAWNALGLALRGSGETEEALAALHEAQALRPDRVDYALHAIETAPDLQAELQHQSALSDASPLNPASRIGVGMLLERLGRQDEAIDALEAAAALAPGEPEPLKLLAGVLTRSTRMKEAEAALRQVCLLAPDDPKPANDHAAILMRLHRHAEARRVLLDLLDRFGPHPSVLCNLANATTCLGRQAEGVAFARQAIELAPEAMLPRRSLCNNLPYLDGTDGAGLLTAMQACSAVLPRSVRPPLANTRDPNRKLTIGLLSGSLRSHPVGWLTVAGFETLDPEQFRIICLVQKATPNDPIARRYRAISADWIDVDGLSDEALADLAREVGVDILIDLGGYGDAGRMHACAHRLAPVQVKWVGMQCHSTGLAEMDWFITDRWETPPGFERFYSEKLMRLPDGYVCYTPPPHAPDVTPLPALASGTITFGCFNNLAKITPRVIETWSRILGRIPGSRMVLKTHQMSDPETAAAFVAAFGVHGIDPGRIETRGSSGHRAFMAQYGDIDILLDPFPYSGGLTTCEALWMGVPTVTLPGEIFASRHSASHMSNAGLADWVVPTLDAYVEAAVAHAADIPALAALREGLREQVRRSPLCDAPRFGRGLGAALREAWRDWCAGG